MSVLQLFSLSNIPLPVFLNIGSLASKFNFFLIHLLFQWTAAGTIAHLSSFLLLEGTVVYAWAGSQMT